MNFAGPFDSELTHGSPVSLGGERFTFDSKPGFTQHHASDSHVIIPDAHLLFSGDYTRIGSDLIISGDGQKFVVGNYFKGETRPALVSKDGATLSGHIVDSLTGHVHYAQAAGAPAAGQVIGNVLKMSGSATAIRNGVSIELHIGDAVQKGDVVQTGSDSSIGMTFVDGSAFGMNSNARMVLNEMIYDPNGSSNSSLISLVQGTITFVAGQTAKNGNMRVETPVATMGIRGTAVLVEIGANDGPTKFSVLVEPDGHTGSYNLYDKTSGELIGTVSQAGQVTFVSVNGIGQPPTAIEQLKTLADQQAEKALIQQVFQLFFPNYNPDNSNPKSQKTGFGSPSDNINPFLFNNTAPDNQPIKIIVIPGVGNDPVTGQPNPPRIFYNTKAQFSADTVTAEQSITSSVKTFKISDVVHIDDPDIGNGPFFDTATPFVGGSAVIKSAVSTNPNLSASFLSQFLHIDQQTGEVTFDRLGFNFLGEGETATFMLQVLSQSGPDSATVIIPIIISGNNDKPNDDGVPNGTPTIVLPLSDIVGGVKEDTLVVASSIAKDGTITFRDVDLTDTHTIGYVFKSSSSALPGFATDARIGEFSINLDPENTTDIFNTGTVQWHFSLPDNDPTLQSLAEGQTITQVYTITITDQYGAGVTQDVTITITGTNDDPVVTGSTDDHPSLAEDGTLSASGVVSFTDIDLVDTHVVTQALTGGSISSALPGFDPAHDQLGTLALTLHEDDTDTDNTASVDWTFTADNALLQKLAAGQVVTQTYTVTINDQHSGEPATQTVVVTITGTNDDAVISVAATDHDAGAVVEDGQGGNEPATGTLSFSDVDLIDTHTITAVSVGATLGTLTAVLIADTSGGNGGSLKWTYNVADSDIQYLAVGETKAETFRVSVFDGTSTVTKDVVVTITGTNDAPTITSAPSEATVALSELIDTTGSTALDHAGGTVTFGDVDLTDTLQVTQSDAAFAWSGGVLTSTQLTDLADASARTLVPHDSTGTGGGSIDWTYKITDSALDFLALGQTLTVTYDITVADYHNSVATGTSTSQTVTVTYTGSNDAPTVAAVTETVIDTAGADVFTARTGTLVGTDVDNGETATLTYAGFNGTAYVTTAVVGLYGALTVNSNGGYNYVPNAAAVNALNAGNYTDSFTVQTTDVHGVSGAATFTVHVTGANDTPIVSAALTDTVSEGGASFTKDLLLNASDVDTGDTLSIASLTYKVDAGIPSGTAPAGVSLSGSTLSINPADPSFNHLSVGQHATILVSYDVTDAHGATIDQTETITINGTNDAPAVSSANVTLTSQALGATKVSGLSVSDVDDGGSGQFTLTTSVDHGIITPHISTGTLSAINAALQTGLIYTPTDNSPIGHGTLTVTDNQGASEAVNFVFRQSGSSPLNLMENANQKDVLIGGSGVDQFVFAEHSGQDTVLNFTHGTDKIDFQAISSIDTSTLTALLANATHPVASDTLLHLNGTTDTLLLKGVATLNASDFILHA